MSSDFFHFPTFSQQTNRSSNKNDKTFLKLNQSPEQRFLSFSYAFSATKQNIIAIRER
jgi:hypothetical protein